MNTITLTQFKGYFPQSDGYSHNNSHSDLFGYCVKAIHSEENKNNAVYYIASGVYKVEDNEIIQNN